MPNYVTNRIVMTGEQSRIPYLYIALHQIGGAQQNAARRA